MNVRPATIRADLPVPGVGALAARVSALENGRVRYVVRGPHVRGTFVVVPEHVYGGTVLPSTVTVQYGDGTDPVGSHYSTHRPDEPVVYGVRLHGWTGEIDPDDVPNGYFVGRYANNLRDNGVHRELSRGVRRRTEAVLRAIVGHWRQLPHLTEVLAAAARLKAADMAEHEAELAARAEAETLDLDQARAHARNRLNAITGIIRRTPQAIRPSDPVPIDLPIVDHRNRPMGNVTVREVAVNDTVPGTVVYSVTGARVHGRFTVGRDIYRPLPMPEGIWIAYGQAQRRYFEHERKHEPTINGVSVSGEWDHSTTDDLTATTPATMPARVRTGRSTGHSAPTATERRASAVLRVLALHYLARSDADALRLAAAQDRAPEHRGTARGEVRDLRVRQAAARARALHHRNREQQYRALTDARHKPASRNGQGPAVRLRAA